MKRNLTLRFIAAAAGLLGVAAPGAPPEEAPPAGISERARAVHASAILVDGHNDLPWEMRLESPTGFAGYDLAQRLDRGHTDIPRLRAGGVKAQFWSVYVPANLAKR